jgi:hypothetical protein
LHNLRQTTVWRELGRDFSRQKYQFYGMGRAVPSH